MVNELESKPPSTTNLDTALDNIYGKDEASKKAMKEKLRPDPNKPLDQGLYNEIKNDIRKNSTDPNLNDSLRKRFSLRLKQMAQSLGLSKGNESKSQSMRDRLIQGAKQVQTASAKSSIDPNTQVKQNSTSFFSNAFGFNKNKNERSLGG